jgi:hypothetical protein
MARRPDWLRLVGYFLKDLEEGWFWVGDDFVGEVFVMGEGGEVGKMRGVVVAED